MFDQSTLAASFDILAGAAVAIGAGAASWWGGVALARIARQQLTSAAGPRIVEKLG